MSLDSLKEIIQAFNDPKIYDNIITNNLTPENLIKLENLKEKLCLFLHEYKHSTPYIYEEEEELDEYEKIRDIESKNNYSIINSYNYFTENKINSYEYTDFMV